MRIICAAALLVFTLLANAVRADWSMPIDAAVWKATSTNADKTAKPDSHLEGRPGAGSANSQRITASSRVNDGAVEFSVPGDAPELRSATWELAIPGDQQPVQYVSLQYKSFGVDRGYTKVNVITVEGKDASGKDVRTAAVVDPQIINDRNWHTLTVKLENAITPAKLTLQLGTTDSSLEFSIRQLHLHSAASAAANGFVHENDWKQIKLSKDAFHSLDLSARLNASADQKALETLDRRGAVSDAGLSFRDTYVSVEGIPFHLGDSDRNLLFPRETPVNPGKQFFFGEMVDRAALMPEMRDDVIPLEIERKASELYLLLVNDFPVTTSRYGLPDAPYEITDIDAFRIELIYEDGTRDRVFPYSVADGGFIVRRACGAYVVPCDPSKVLLRAEVHNCITAKTVGLMAATVNIESNRLFPQTVDYPAAVVVRQIPETKRQPVASAIQLKDKLLTVAADEYTAEIDLSNGFAIKSLVHRGSVEHQVKLSPDSGLSVRVGGKALTGSEFNVIKTEVNGASATIQLQSKQAAVPLAITIRLNAADTRELVFGATISNQGKAPTAASLTFPYLKDLSLGEQPANWLYFPQYRAVLTNKNGFYRAPNDRSFAVQFFDLFNPDLGVGIGVMTHNREGLPLDYLAAKNESGVTAGIVYPDSYWPIEPGASRELPDTGIIFHSGDWHQALQIYRDWAAKNLPSIDATSREWFKNVWLFRSQVVSDPEARGINHTPGILDRKAGKYRIDESFNLDELYYGIQPQAFHFYNWFYDEKLGEEVWGDYSTASYNNAGGLELMRSTIEDLQTRRKIPASLYLIPDRCSKASDFGKAHGNEIVARGADGAIVEDPKTFYICPAVKLWQDHFVDTAVRVQKETGAEILYLDVFAFYRGHSCFAKDHGHPVPMAINQSSLELLMKLRDKLPKDVVLYSEYPCTDLAANLIDGNLQYYNLSLEEHFIRSHDIGDHASLYGSPVQSIDRFAFPNLKQFSFVVGLDGDDNKGTRIKPVFFNGEGILDPTWRLYPGVHREFLQKTFQLRNKYTDCFASASVTPLIPTKKTGVYANAFEGKGRTLYTIYNARFTPVDGEIIALPCQPGDTFIDAWNGLPLKPETNGNLAVISLKLQPQSIGCIVREHP